MGRKDKRLHFYQLPGDCASGYVYSIQCDCINLHKIVITFPCTLLLLILYCLGGYFISCSPIPTKAVYKFVMVALGNSLQILYILQVSEIYGGTAGAP